jgi:hypothetical protein
VSGTALRVACQNSYQDVGLIEAIVRTYPPALCIARNALSGGLRRLPFDAAAERVSPDNGTPALEFLRRETIEMALAAVEHALQSTTYALAMSARAAAATAAAAAAPCADDEDGADEDDNIPNSDYAYHADKDDHATRIDKFRLRVLAAVSRAVLPTSTTTTTTSAPTAAATAAAAGRGTSMSGFCWAQVLRESDRCLDVCRELFVCPITSCLVLEDVTFRETVLGTTAVNLYRMNKAVGGRADPSPHRQVRLLALVSDDLDSIYLQFREFGSIHIVSSQS